MKITLEWGGRIHYDELHKCLCKYLGDPLNWRMSHRIPPRRTLKRIARDLEVLDAKYPNQYHIRNSLCDVYFLLQDYHKALVACPEPDSRKQWTIVADKRLGLKHLLKMPCKAEDLLPLFPKKLTKFGKDNFLLVVRCLDQLIEAWENDHNCSVLSYMVRKYAKAKPKTYLVFNATMFSAYIRTNGLVEFRSMREFEDIVHSLTREAENTVREEMGIPKVGEGWVSETELYYKVKHWLSGLQVIHHGRPTWLERQHLDIWIPEIRCAIEYQGQQHDKPIGFFGGEEVFAETKARDDRKRNLCRRHGVMLIYVRDGYIDDDVRKQLLKRARDMGKDFRDA